MRGAWADLLGRQERLLVLRDALVQDDAVRGYVNNIPPPERAVRRIMAAIGPYPYDGLSAACRRLDTDARVVVTATAQRCFTWLQAEPPDEPES